MCTVWLVGIFLLFASVSSYMFVFAHPSMFLSQYLCDCLVAFSNFCCVFICYREATIEDAYRKTVRVS